MKCSRDSPDENVETSVNDKKIKRKVVNENGKHNRRSN